MKERLGKGDRTGFDSRPEGEGTSLLQIKHEGHTYTEGDLVEFDWVDGGHMRAHLVPIDTLFLRSDTPDVEGYRPNVLAIGGLCGGITNLRPVKFGAVDLKEGGIITLRLTVDNITITGPLERDDDCLKVGLYYVTNRHGELLDHREILDYAPPEEPEFEWDRPEVFAVKDGDGDLWARGSDGWQCVTADGYDAFTTQMLAKCPPIIVHAVLAEEA